MTRRTQFFCCRIYPDPIAGLNTFFARHNDAPLPAFSGLSPALMHKLLSDPWAPASLLRLRPELPAEVLEQIPFLRLTEELLRVVQRDGFIKLTVLGVLPANTSRPFPTC